MTQKAVVIVLHGPSGVGKDTVIDLLRERTGIHRATSSTDRAPRDYESDGSHYHFLSTSEFEAKIAAGEFIEHAKVYGDWKGVERREVEPFVARGEDVIIRTDVNGARTWREKLDGAVFVFLNAEDVSSLRARLEGRGSEDGDSLRKRLDELEEELADIPNNDHVLVNGHGQLEETVAKLQDIIESERSNPTRLAPRIRATSPGSLPAVRE